MPNEYVPDKSILTCDKGSAPCQLKVTHANNTKIYGELMASEMDMMPNENIMPMGICSITGGPCQPDPIYWDKTMDGVKVNGFKLLVKEAHLLCKQGGKVGIEFNAPISSVVTGAENGLSVWGTMNKDYANVVDKIQRGIIYDVESGKVSLIRPNSPSDFRRQGNYGEMKDNVYHNNEGWKNISNDHPAVNIDKPTLEGLDAAYTKDNVIKATDGKYNTAQLKNTVRNGRQLSTTWVDNHVQGEAINPEYADEMSTRNFNGTLEREIIRTNTNGTMQSETVNGNGYKGRTSVTSELEVPKVATFMESVRSSVRNTNPLTVLAESNFSKTVQTSAKAIAANNWLWRNQGTVEAVGKVVGKGALVVGIVMDGINIYTSYEAEGGFGKKTQEAAGSAAGGLAGGWAGAEAGAIIGSCICPGVGTVIGGVVGGIIGGIAGSSFGKAIADWF